METKDKKFHIKCTTKKPVNHLNKTPSQNILKHAPGPRLAVKRARPPLEAFSLFKNQEMLNTIAENTNTVIETFLSGKQDMIDESDKYSFYKKVDLIDIKAFLGLLYLRACLKLNMFDRETMWHHEMANDFFEATMSLNRLVFISRFTTFDEKSTRAERWRYYKFACMPSFFESFNKNISVVHLVTLLLTKLCTHIMEELDSNSIILVSQPNMGCYIACFVMLQYITLTFPCLTLVSQKFSIKKIQQQATMLLELMSTLSILSMTFPLLPTCLVATSLWIDILLLSH